MQACALTLDSFTRMLIHRGSRTLLNFYGSAPGTPSLRSTILALWATMQIDRSTTAARNRVSCPGRATAYAGQLSTQAVPVQRLPGLRHQLVVRRIVQTSPAPARHRHAFGNCAVRTIYAAACPLLRTP